MTTQKSAGKVTVRFVPTSGSPRTIEVNKTETSLDSILKEARVSAKGQQITVDGRVVTDLKTRVAADAVVVVTERARGS
jgi:hypothetical protein